MRSEENPLDLNNLPDDYSKDGKQVLEDTSSYSGYRKKKSGGKEDKDESGKVYECRFCSLKFFKSQALGGHMNRHRQERETETLNRARQLVFTNDNILGQAAAHHLGNGQQFHPHGGYHPTSNNINGDPSMSFRTMYTPRMYADSSPTSLHPIPPPPPPPYMYPSPARLIPYPSQYPVVNDYILGHAVPQGTATPPSMGATTTTHHHHEINNHHHTCIGAPVGPAFPHSNNGRSSSEGGGSNGGSGGTSFYNHDQEMTWARNCMTGTQHRF